MMNIALIGCGNIGFRHLQSLLTLDQVRHKIHVVDLDKSALERAQQEASNNKNIEFHNSLELLPKKLDVTIIATSSRVREKVIMYLLENHNTDHLILEKFLFPNIEAYDKVQAALVATDTSTTVNCPTRIWPIMASIKKHIIPSQVEAIKISAPGSDMGCNGIHYLDLASYFTGSHRIENSEFKLQSYYDAKRVGYLGLAGTFLCDIKLETGSVPVEISAPEQELTGAVVSIMFKDGNEIVTSETGPVVSVKASGKFSEIASQNWTVPYQSVLTSTYIDAISNDKPLEITSYEESSALHKTMLLEFIAELNKVGALEDKNYCPVT